MFILVLILQSEYGYLRRGEGDNNLLEGMQVSRNYAAGRDH